MSEYPECYPCPGCGACFGCGTECGPDCPELQELIRETGNTYAD